MPIRSRDREGAVADMARKSYPGFENGERPDGPTAAPLEPYTKPPAEAGGLDLSND